MKMTFEKPDLINMINTVQKAVAAKSVMPILECIRLDAYVDGTVVITANNLDICAEYEMKADVTEPGSIAISSKMFGEIIRSFPNGDVFISVNEENNVMLLRCSNSEFNIQGLDSKDYPAVPEVEEIYKFSITEEKIKRMIRKTIFAVSASEAKRPVLTGSLFEINTGVLTVVSSDGYRIARITSTVDADLQDVKFIIPGLTQKELLKVLEDSDDKIEITIAKRYVKFSFEGYTIFSRLIEGEYINYKPIFNTPNSIVVNANTKNLSECIERTALIINDDIMAKNEKVPVRLKISNEKIDMSCSTGKGQTSDMLEVSKIGNDIEIGFNHRYLLEALRCCDDENVRMEMSGAKGACFIKPEQESDYDYMVLPVRLYE